MDSLYIRLLLDDSAPLYPDDVAGSLLVEGDGKEGRTSYGRVDLWLLELAEGVNGLESSPEMWVDLTGERESLRLFRDETAEGVEFCGENWRLSTGSIKKAVIAAADEFVSAFRGFRPFAEESPLARLAEWLDAQEE